MKIQLRQISRSWLWLALMLLLNCPANAGVVPNGGIDSAISKSDVICVGTVKSVNELAQGLFDSGTGYAAEAGVARADVSVETVLAGSLSGTRLHLLYPVLPSPPQMSSTYRHYPQVVAGERAIFFLSRLPSQRETDAESFEFYSPFALPEPLVPIGTASLKGVLAAATPLRRLILTLVRTLDVPDKAIRSDCLQRLGGIGYLLYVKPGVYNDEYGVKSRSVFSEPVSTPQSAGADLESFVKSRVLPPVLKLTMNSNAEVREQAALTLGRLQDVDMIPVLTKIADKQYKPGENGEAASILGFYRNPAATRPLVGVLDDSNPSVRERAAYSLRELADPVAVPSLLEHTDDPDPDARYFIVTALYTATNTPEHPDMMLFRADEGKYVSFWKKWADEHQDKVTTLRDQFLTPPPARAARPQVSR